MTVVLCNSFCFLSGASLLSFTQPQLKESLTELATLSIPLPPPNQKCMGKPEFKTLKYCFVTLQRLQKLKESNKQSKYTKS